MRPIHSLAVAVLAAALAPAALRATDILLNPGETSTATPLTIDVRDVTQSACIPLYLPPHQQGNTFRIVPVPITAFCIPSPPRVDDTILLAHPQIAGTYTVEVASCDAPECVSASRTITLTGPEVALGLLGNSIQLQVRWTDPVTGAVRPAFPVNLTDESAYFWFFDDQKAEVTIKVLDGRTVNGHRWIFIASMTDLPFTVSVGYGSCLPAPANPLLCYEAKTYANPGGNRNFLDVNGYGGPLF